MADGAFVLQDRAENYTGREIEEVGFSGGRLHAVVREYLKSDEVHPLMIVGPKGYGKTHSVLKAINERMSEDPYMSPSVVSYVPEKGVVQSDPLNIASESMWESRRKGNIPGRDVLVIDNIHYMCEDVMAGRRKAGDLYDLLEGSVEQSRHGKKLILVSENAMGYYAEKIADDRMDDLLPGLGEVSPRRRYTGDRNRVDHMAMVTVEPTSFYEWDEILDSMGIGMDDASKSVIYNLSVMPRFAVRVSKEVGCNVMYESLRKHASGRLSSAASYAKGGAIKALKRLDRSMYDLPPRVMSGMELTELKDIGKVMTYLEPTADGKMKRVSILPTELEAKIDSLDRVFRTEADRRGMPKLRDSKETKRWRKNPRYAFIVSSARNPDAKSAPENAVKLAVEEALMWLSPSTYTGDMENLANICLSNPMITNRVMSEYENYKEQIKDRWSERIYSQPFSGTFVLDEPFRAAFQDILYQA